MEYNKTMNIQWNRVTWYSKAVALVLFVGLPFLGFYWGLYYGKIEGANNASHLTPTVSQGSASEGTSGLIPYYTTPSEWQTDANNTAGAFSIAYPIDFTTQDNYTARTSTDWRWNANGIEGVNYFTLTVPRAFAPQTNFVNAVLTVGASSNATAIAQCMQQSQNGELTATSSAVINGVPFTLFHSNGVGAGNYYDTTSYRTIHAGKCYAVEYTVHSTQIMNYPASYHLKPFSKSRIDSLMKRIVDTFKFT